MKRQLLFACAALLGMSSWAQTDVTSTYLTNAGFDNEADWVTENVTLNPVVQLNADGWTVNAGESWAGIATLQVGSNVLMNNAAIPATNANGIAEGGVIGVASSWGSFAAYEQTVTLPAGNYTISYDAYEANSGATAGIEKNLCGFITDGKEYLSKKAAYTLNTWTRDEISFTLTEETTGKISMGYKSKNITSNSTPKLFIDNVTITMVSALEVAQKEAIASLPAAGDGFFSMSAEDVDVYRTAIEAATTPEEVSGVMDEVLGWTAPALSGEWNILNVSASMYLGTNGEGVVLSEVPVKVTFEQAEGGYYIKAGESYINMKGGNTWSMSAAETASTAWAFTLVDGKYTIKGPNGLIGSDATAAGSALYGNKAVANNGYWTISAAASDDETALIVAKNALKSAIGAITVPEANIGVTFGYKTAAVTGIPAELETAQDILENSEDLDEINYEIEQLKGAKDYLASEDAKIAPANEGEKYSFVLTFGGWAYDNKAITYIANGRGDAGNYNIQYNSELNLNYAQAFTMTQVEGGYKMSQIDAEGKERFICTGVVYGGNASQIRTTTNADEALVVKVIPTAVEGKFNLWNTEANQYIGSQDAGVFTVNSHIDFNIVMAQPGKGDYINIWPEDKYATICSPHAVHLTTDAITVYTVDGVEENGTTLVMTELPLEDNTIPANTPVLLYAENGASNQHAGFGTAYAGMNLTKGLLTGVYADTNAPVGSYVMQNHEGVVGFYQVENEGDAQMWAYKCYLTVESGDAPEVKAFTMGGVATGIQAVEALTAGKAQIFDLNGRQQSKLQKGINIVNGVKVLVK